MSNGAEDADLCIETVTRLTIIDGEGRGAEVEVNVNASKEDSPEYRCVLFVKFELLSLGGIEDLAVDSDPKVASRLFGCYRGH